jgi:hypothetical protein
MTLFTLKRIERLRAHNYHRTRTRRVQTLREAERFVQEAGFCFLWPIKGVEMPSLFHAIAGRVRDVPMAHDDPDLSKCWNWKDQSLGAKRWYYAKLLSRRATLISLEFLPAFYALSPNYGDDEDYLREYEAGLLSREAKNIYEALQKSGPLHTVRLRKEAGLAADSAKSTFERALADLQVGMKIVPTGVAEAGAWRYSFIYDLVTRQFPEAVAQARQISRSRARALLVRRYLDNVVAVSRAEIARVFGVLRWTPHELEKTLAALLENHQAATARIEGERGDYLVSTEALKAA